MFHQQDVLLDLPTSNQGFAHLASNNIYRMVIEEPEVLQNKAAIVYCRGIQLARMAVSAGEI